MTVWLLTQRPPLRVIEMDLDFYAPSWLSRLLTINNYVFQEILLVATVSSNICNYGLTEKAHSSRDCPLCCKARAGREGHHLTATTHPVRRWSIPGFLCWNRSRCHQSSLPVVVSSTGVLSRGMGRCSHLEVRCKQSQLSSSVFASDKLQVVECVATACMVSISGQFGMTLMSSGVTHVALSVGIFNTVLLASFIYATATATGGHLNPMITLTTILCGLTPVSRGKCGQVL